MVLMFSVVYILRALCLLGVFLVCIFSVCFVHAADLSLGITEIMYDAEGGDDGKEFVEVVNTGSRAIDMTSVKFFERNDRPDRPGASLVRGQGGVVLQPGEVAVIVAKPDLFLQHYSFDGIVLDTRNFALLNAGATVSLELDGHLLHSIAYTVEDGASGDGDSLHITSSDVIVVDRPSPGVVHGAVVDDFDVDERNEEVDTVVDSSGNDKEDVIGERAAGDQVGVGAQRRPVEEVKPPVFVSDPAVIFSASTTRFSVVRQRNEMEEALYGLWNFGDGSYTYGTVVEHAYLHPGAYIIVFQELHADESEGFALQKEIRVLFPQVGIERIDDVFVRLHNRHPFVLDVSGWRIESQGTVFDFPMQSLVPRQGSIVVPFSSDERHDVFFVTAGGGQFSGAYASPNITIPDGDKEQKTDDVAVLTVSNSVPTPQTSSEVEDGVIVQERVSDVTHTVADFISDQEEGRVGRSVRMIVVWIVLLIGVMVIALVPFIFMRREKERRFER